MSKFKHIEKPTALPGCCTSCGRATDPNGFVDTSLDIDMHGAIQFCYRCIRAMHATFGFDANARQIISEETVANVKHLVDVVQMLKKDNEAQLGSLLNYVSGLDRSFAQSYELLVQAAGARERIIKEAAERAIESSGVDELGLDSDEL